MPARKTETAPSRDRETLLADNRKARFDYDIERRLEAGVAPRRQQVKNPPPRPPELPRGHAPGGGSHGLSPDLDRAPPAHAPHTKQHPPLPPEAPLPPAQ